jgi:hypothetical protein
MALWTQELFTVAIVVACTVRRRDATLRGYEAGAMFYVVTMTNTSAFMVWVSCLQHIDRLGLWLALVLGNGLLSVYVQASPAQQQQKHWKVMNACLEIAGAYVPFNMRVPVLLLTVAVMVVAIVAWIYLYHASNWDLKKTTACVPIPQLRC